MTVDQTVAAPADAVAADMDGVSVAVDGFGLTGVPVALLEAVLDRGVGRLWTVDALLLDHLRPCPGEVLCCTSSA